MTPLSSIHENDQQQLRKMHEDVFGEAVDDLLRLKGDASDRVIVRIHSANYSSIGIIGPNREENLAFTGFARSFRSLGLNVPKIYHIAKDQRCYLEEDLGDMTLSRWQADRRTGITISEEVLDMYTQVLAQLQRFQIDAAESLDYGLCYQYDSFAEEAMAFDIRYFREMFLTPIVQLPWDADAFESDCGRLIHLLLEADRSHFLYRDFQSRNIMIRDEEPWFIDFQSGRRGALHYDVAALLYDSKGDLPADARHLLLSRYLDMLEARGPIHRERFRFLFDGFAVLRLMQALGAFGNIGLNKNRPRYLELIPSRLRHLAELVQDAELMRDLPYLRTLLLDIAENPDSCFIPTTTD
jgi:aminoglycoside/choline kinase family phosphotransferase